VGYERRLPVRFPDVDYARVVYYPRFFDYCHQVMEDFFRDEVKVSYVEMLTTRKVGFPSVHAEADFSKPLRFGDEARIVMESTKVGQGSVHLRFTLFNGDATEKAAVVKVVVASVNMDTFTGVPMPDDVKQAFERHRAAAP
jgi:4-hydroxybenzoyl-CoA thioesterase